MKWLILLSRLLCKPHEQAKWATAKFLSLRLNEPFELERAKPMTMQFKEPTMKKSRLTLLSLLTLLPFSASAETQWWKPMSEISGGDTAWVMISAILVLFITIPRLALFYGGMVRKKNVLSTMMHSFSVSALISILWVICGYSLAFTEGNAFIGGFDRLFLQGMGLILHKKSQQLHLTPRPFPKPFLCFSK